MEVVRKNFYTIPEAAILKGISEESLLQSIREGKIQLKQIGIRMMVPAAALREEKEKEDRTEQYLEQIKPDLINMLAEAPEYGSCGIVITFHSGKITKVNRQRETTKIEEKKNEKN